MGSYEIPPKYYAATLGLMVLKHYHPESMTLWVLNETCGTGKGQLGGING